MPERDRAAPDRLHGPGRTRSYIDRPAGRAPDVESTDRDYSESLVRTCHDYPYVRSCSAIGTD